jgi:hypothetical protein
VLRSEINNLARPSLFPCENASHIIVQSPSMQDANSLLAPPVAVANPGTMPESVNCVLESRLFEKAPALRALLIYLWQHREEAISEYAIATEALGRNRFFDARTDATVRVQISRLRQRLDRFYEGEGNRCRERLIIPLGSHQVQVQSVTPNADLISPDVSNGICPDQVVVLPGASAANVTASHRRTLLALGLVIAGLLVACGVQGVLLHQAHLAGKTPSLNSVPRPWKSFFANGRATRIILPTPTFFSFSRKTPSGNGSIMFRDTEVNEFSTRSNSPSYLALARELGQPTLAENYTVTSDTFASVRLARYLDKFGLQTTVESSADAPLEALDTENVIAVGTWGTLTPLKPYLDRMSFELGPHEDFVRLRSPAPGEPKRVDAVPESPDRGIWPGVIAYLPGRGGQTHLLILASRHTAALVSFLTSTNGLDQLERMWKAKGSPEYYEVIVNAELSGPRALVRFWPVALHPYKNPT